MRLSFFILWVSLLIPFSQPGCAQNTLSGVVKDKVSGKPLAGANILLEDQHLGTSTDQHGHFSLSGVPSGRHILSLSYIGYELKKLRIDTQNDSTIVIQLIPEILPGEEVRVTAFRARHRDTPVAFSNKDREDIQKQYWAQDIPMLLSDLPNVYSYSDAGNGLGYSTLKIRGFDQSRVGVMINGIPLNDPEDHQVYWVDMPDLASSIEDIQIQRGVSNSLFGVSAFGGSVNLQTSTLNQERGIRASVGSGSYQTRKFSLSMSSGLVDNQYAIYGRFSRITSDGYRDRSGVDLWAYFLSAAKYGEHTTTQFNLYGGPEITYASWDAVRQDLLQQNRKYNPTSAGYHNTIDNFNQPHYELHHDWRLSPTLHLKNSVFYIKGKGYYEGLKQNESLKAFGFSPLPTRDPILFGADSLQYYQTTISNGRRFLHRDSQGRFLLTHTDLVRQKWVEKHQVGWIPQLQWRHNKKGRMIVGGHIDRFESSHWGTVLWTQVSGKDADPDQPYYKYSGKKWTAALYLHEHYALSEKMTLVADLQTQYKEYTFLHAPSGNFSGSDLHRYSVNHLFLNPKVGMNININPALNMFSSLSVSNREPAADQYFDTWKGPDDLGAHPLFRSADTLVQNDRILGVEWNDPFIKPERVYDLELGMGYQFSDWIFKGNLYWMDFQNEIIPYGQVNDDGQPIRGNADRTLHRGIELHIAGTLLSTLSVDGNLAWTQNQYQSFHEKTWAEDGSIVSVDYSGNTLPLFPGYLAHLNVHYRLSTSTLSVHLSTIGRQYLDNTQQKIRSLDPYTVLDMSLSLDLNALFGLRGMTMDFHANNVLNQKYLTSGYYDPWSGANYVFPAATRNGFVQLDIKL
jgi:iron complex outermembrane receptor protein